MHTFNGSRRWDQLIPVQECIWLPKRTSRYEVVDVNRIQRGVHLIPKFGNTLYASETEVPIDHFGPEIFQHFEEFFLNSWKVQ